MTKCDRFEELPVCQHAREIGARMYELVESEQLLKGYWAKDQWNGTAISVSNTLAGGDAPTSNLHFMGDLAFAKGASGALSGQLFLLKKLGEIKNQLDQSMDQNLGQLSNEWKGLVTYLREFEVGKKKDYKRQEFFHCSNR